MKKRVIIDSWDWHYRVGFDKALAKKVKLIASELQNKSEQQILLQQFDIFSSMVSISALCDALEENPEQFENYISGIDNCRLLYIPASLETIFRDRIEQLPHLLATEKKEVIKLLSTAIDSDFINYHQNIFEPIFGNELKCLTDKGLSNIPLVPKDKLIDRDDLRETVNYLLEMLIKSARVSALLGDIAIPDFDIILKEGPGFAEYWPAELLDSTFNQLIIFDNPDQLHIGTLQTTLAHEVLGHSVFYEAESNYVPPFFDHGAMCLVEGWATWCEWNASERPYGEFSRDARLFGLRNFYEKDADKLLQTIAHDIRSLGYTDAAVTSGLVYFFQYPGFSLSYTLGALWFEKKFQDIQPSNFFESLKNRPWGDFFKLWQ